MNTPMFLTSASLSSRPQQRHRHRSKRRPLVGVLSGLACAATLGLALLSGVAVGGMGGVLTREVLHRDGDSPVVTAPRAPQAAPVTVLSVRRPPPDEAAAPFRAAENTEAAVLTRAFRKLYNPATTSAAELDLMGPPAPSA
jgi:hypothetical protein